jgi:hypothetical protein
MENDDNKVALLGILSALDAIDTDLELEDEEALDAINDSFASVRDHVAALAKNLGIDLVLAAEEDDENPKDDNDNVE